MESAPLALSLPPKCKDVDKPTDVYLQFQICKVSRSRRRENMRDWVPVLDLSIQFLFCKYLLLTIKILFSSLHLFNGSSTYCPQSFTVLYLFHLLIDTVWLYCLSLTDLYPPGRVIYLVISADTYIKGNRAKRLLGHWASCWTFLPRVWIHHT